MSNHHHHHDDHDHSHHNHDHHHHDKESSLSFDEKMIKLLEHWIRHNSDHAGTYQDWGKKASENGMSEISSILAEVSEMTLTINKKFEEALAVLEKK